MAESRHIVDFIFFCLGFPVIQNKGICSIMIERTQIFSLPGVSKYDTF